MKFKTDRGNKLADKICKRLGNDYLYDDLATSVDCGLELNGTEEDDFEYINGFLSLEDNEDREEEANLVLEFKQDYPKSEVDDARQTISYLRKVRKVRAELDKMWEATK